ncbi:MAG TPA: hypothetical protein VKC66_05705 [Xanthobacteraceae bacterium]|nr:hypothetical protein [Xanthobacteraceae bacterium]
MLPEIEPFKPRVLETSLSNEQENALRDAMAARITTAAPADRAAFCVAVERATTRHWGRWNVPSAQALVMEVHRRSL